MSHRRRLFLAGGLAALLTSALLTAGLGSKAEAYIGEHREFQVTCTVNRQAPDDPIVFPNMPGASHLHSFVGNTKVTASTTTESLFAAGVGSTTCPSPDDLSAYWWPTLLRGNQPAAQTWHQTIYYKSGIENFREVQPFPRGLRFVAGDAKLTSTEGFRTAPGTVRGWECGSDADGNWEIPSWCLPGSHLTIRYQAPSCWDGVNLDSPDHKSHMAYPVPNPNDYGKKVCPPSHPKPLVMLEFKISFETSGDMSDVRLSSGSDQSWHYDFFNAWDQPTLAALVKHCINGGLQCDTRGYDQHNPSYGAALGTNHRLPGRS